MTEQRANWFQRLVGTDGNPNLPAIEEQLAKVREEAQQLLNDLARERELVALRDQQLEEARAIAYATSQDFEARLVEVRKSNEERIAAHDELEKQHKQATGELAIARNQLIRQRDESAKLNKSLGAANAQLTKHEAAVQSSREQATELEGKLAEEAKASQAARSRVQELERAVDASAKEAADAKRRLQAIETRASTVEHELAETKQAQQQAKSDAQRAATQLQSSAAEKELAARVTTDAWNALQRAVGDAAPLALSLGVDVGKVESTPNLSDAVAALKSALEAAAHCQVLKLEVVEQGVVAELQAVPKSSAATAWLVAFSCAYLEKATGLELAVDSMAASGDKLTYRLMTSVSTA